MPSPTRTRRVGGHPREPASSGMSHPVGTPILRSLFLLGAFMFVSFGLWNVLLLPFAITVLGATEFEYGLQEGLTSVGFVVGSLFMARFAGRLPEPVWIVISLVGMGIVGIAVRPVDAPSPSPSSSSTITGFFNPPSSISRRRPAPAEHAARDARSRVLGVLRHARRDLPHRHGRRRPGRRRRHPGADRGRVQRCSSSRPSSRSSPRVSARPGACAAARLRTASAAAGAAVAARPATLADFDRLVGRLAAFGRLSPEMRADLVVRRRRSARSRPGRGSSSTATPRRGVLHPRRLDHGGRPGRRRLPRASRRWRAGDFFGEIAALTGSPRTADVVADADTTLLEVPAETLRATMAVPEIDQLVLSTLTSGCPGRRRRTCRASPASTRPTCATCARRDRPSRRCRGRTPTATAGLCPRRHLGRRAGGGRTHRPALRYGGRRRARRPGRTAATGHASHRGMR